MADADAPNGEAGDRLKRVVPVPLPARASDLPVRLASAMVMLGLAGVAVALGGWWLRAFIGLVALAAMIEFTLLVMRATDRVAYRLAAFVGGLLYFGLSALFFAAQRPAVLVILALAVVLTDTGAYFVGRAVGGPKIAPRISPSKTWAGLFGGMAAAAVWLAIVVGARGLATFDFGGGSGAGLDFERVLVATLAGALLAIVAQAGDFFESWLKRKAGVKDSSRLIPGHGGVFDRIDGMVAVGLVAGLFSGFAGL